MGKYCGLIGYLNFLFYLMCIGLEFSLKKKKKKTVIPLVIIEYYRFFY